LYLTQNHRVDYLDISWCDKIWPTKVHRPNSVVALTKTIEEIKEKKRGQGIMIDGWIRVSG
jgi:hypothetical protein